METTDEHEQKVTPQEQSPNKKEIWGAVGLILSFYVAATIISVAIPEENFKMQFVLMLLPALATIGYGYWAAMKENYVILKTVFILMLVLVVLELASRILLRI